MNEIGSEFWTNGAEYSGLQTAFWNDWPGDKAFFVSGRTALGAILEDILQSHKCCSAYLPSYCCHTMIEPFLSHGLSVSFYPVIFRDGYLHAEIDPAHQCDIILVLDYFGFKMNGGESLPKALVIRDLTHTLSSADDRDFAADYVFASFRKWGAVAGAAVACKRDCHFISKEFSPHSAYIAMRNNAYALKAAYIAGRSLDKSKYLELFASAEALLERDYAGYAADELSLDTAATIPLEADARRENAAALLQGLKQIEGIEPIFKELAKDTVPLFVPILVKDEQRDRLRRFLIENDIYCPVHWPVSEFHDLTADERLLYTQELSLVCDQRYGAAEMRRQLDVIRSFEAKNA